MNKLFPIQSRSFVWPAIPVLIYLVVMFNMSVAAGARKSCIEKLRGGLNAVTDASWARSSEGKNHVTVVFNEMGKTHTLRCTFKDDTHVVEDMKLSDGDGMSEFVSSTKNTWFPF
ncbi:UNVERIFIED_ORG: hypothetical protein LHJ69_05455 [Shinella sp. XGS7]|nr:hypothetical protein [Shinella sp. XGS7]